MAAEHKLPTYSIILNAVDGSIASQQASLHAIALAKLSGAVLRVVHVVDETPVRRAGVNVRRATEEMRRRGREDLSAVERRARAEGVKVETLLVEGRPGETILRLAEEEGISLIVMGATGYRDVEHLLTRLGSVSDQVVQSAPCPVLVVRAS